MRLIRLLLAVGCIVAVIAVPGCTCDCTPDPDPTPVPSPTPAPTPTPTPAPTPPPGACTIPDENDSRWAVVGSSTQNPRGAGSLDFSPTRKLLNAAKAEVGDRSGSDFIITLKLLALSVNAAGGCSMQWADEILIFHRAGVYHSYHAVAAGTGGYTGRPDRDAWSVVSAGCGDPVPGNVSRMNLSRGGLLPKWTANLTYLFGPNAEYCRKAGWTDGRSFCAARPDGHPERSACELAVGLPTWSTDQGTCKIRPNPFLYRCNDDAVGGTVTAMDPTGNVVRTIAVTKE